MRNFPGVSIELSSTIFTILLETWSCVVGAQGINYVSYGKMETHWVFDKSKSADVQLLLWWYDPRQDEPAKQCSVGGLAR